MPTRAPTLPSLAVHVAATGGVAFQDGADRGRVLVAGADTGGQWSLMEYVVAPRPAEDALAEPAYGPHRHHDIEETFQVRAGRLRFLLGERLIDLGPGDIVRVPPGVRHGFANLGDEPADLLVTFHPGGFEQLFVRHRSDQVPPPAPLGFVQDAVREFNSAFEDHPDIRPA